MLKIKIAFISCCLCIFAQAQGYFNNTYVQPNINGANSLIEIDSGYLVVGQQPTTIQRKMIFYNLNKQGDTVWVKEYVDGLKIFYPQKILQQGSNYLVFGAIKDSADIENSDLFLASFDENINLNWMKRYGGSYFDNGWDFKKMTDGSFILAGTYSKDSTGKQDFYLLKTDSGGNIIWEKTYGSDRTDICHSVATCTDGGFIMGGSTSLPPNGVIFGNYDAMVIKVDSLGNIEWSKTFGTNNDDNAASVIDLEDSTYLLTTVFEIDFSDHRAQIIKLDYDGNVLWQKEHVYGSYSSLHIPILNKNDRTIVFGGGGKNSQDNFVGCIFKVDPNGNEIWRREYETRNDIDQYIYDLKPTSDGGYIFCGSAFDSINVQRAWVVKLDCFGCDSLLCFYQDSICEDFVSLPEISNTNQEPRLYPNPNTGTFTLNLDNSTLEEAKKLVIFDLNGRLVWQETIAGSGEINTNLPTGMYLVEIPKLGWRKKMMVE